jgi:hypothetical protein
LKPFSRISIGGRQKEDWDEYIKLERSVIPDVLYHHFRNGWNKQ